MSIYQNVEFIDTACDIFFSFNFFLTSNSYCCSVEGCWLRTFYFGSCDWVRMLTKLLERTSKIIVITGWNYAIQSTYPKGRIYIKYLVAVMKYKLYLSKGKKTWQRMRLVKTFVMCFVHSATHYSLHSKRAIFDKFRCVS